MGCWCVIHLGYMKLSIVEKSDTHILPVILKEVRLLRKQVALLLPQENIDEYAHPDRIRRFYDKAIKQFPPVKV